MNSAAAWAGLNATGSQKASTASTSPAAARSGSTSAQTQAM